MKNSIVFSAINSPLCLASGRGILGVLSNFDQIEMKFAKKIGFDVLNNFPKFGFDQ